MQHEPSIDRARLIETVRTVYGLPVEELAFVPVGFALPATHCTARERSGTSSSCGRTRASAARPLPGGIPFFI